MINGSYLKRLRLTNNYTLTQLSDKTGYTPSFLSQVERGLKEPSLSTLRKLSECFNVPLVSFFRSCDRLDREIYVEKSPIQIVQKDMRQALTFPGLKADVEGITPPNKRADDSLAIHGFFCKLSYAQWLFEDSIANPQDFCLYVMQGSIMFISRNTTLYIETGDSMFVRADTPYNIQSLADEDSHLLVFSG